MLIRCYDFETSGIPTEADKHAIVEIGVCDLDIFESGKTFVGSPEATFCNPGRPIDHEAMAVHHITDGMVEGATGDEDMVRWSSGLALLPRCPLFKHKGKKWEDVPTDYLNWIVNKPNDVDATVKANARRWLRQRGEP